MAASKPLWFAARDEHGEPSCTALLRTGVRSQRLNHSRCRTWLTAKLRRPRTLRAQQDQMHVVTLRHDRATGTVCMDASAEVHVRLQGRTAQVQQVGPLWPLSASVALLAHTTLALR